MKPGDVAIAGPTGALVVRHYPADNAHAAGEPVIFVHPVNTGGAIWYDIAPAIDPGRPVLVPDLRGHGRSTKVGPFRAEDYAADVLAVLDYFGFDRAHVVGASIGGPVGVLLAARAPSRVASIASFGGALTLTIEPQTLAAVRGLLVESGVDALLAQLLPAALAPANQTEALIRSAIQIARGMDRPARVVLDIIEQAFATDVTALAADVRVPSLVVNGSADTTCTVEDGRRMADALGSEPVVLDGVGHLPMLEDPAAITALLAGHLAAPRPAPLW